MCILHWQMWIRGMHYVILQRVYHFKLATAPPYPLPASSTLPPAYRLHPTPCLLSLFEGFPLLWISIVRHAELQILNVYIFIENMTTFISKKKANEANWLAVFMLELNV